MLQSLSRSLRWFRKDSRAYVDAKYYRSTYADVANVGADPFRHYMDHGWREGRNPSAAFNTLYYRDQVLHGEDINPLTHYLEVGASKGLAPVPPDEAAFIDIQRPLVVPFFDPGFYAMRVGQLSEDPLTHYLRVGWRDGIAPNAQFDVTLYNAQHVFLRALGVSPLYHFASQRRLQKILSVGQRTAPMMARTAPTAEVRAVVGPEFDAARYKRLYKDVDKAGLDPLSHYLEHGWREGRQPSPMFDDRYYLATNPDVYLSNVQPYFHYLTIGRAQGRRGNPVGVRLYPPLRAPAETAWLRVTPAASARTADYVVIMPVYRGFAETLAAIHAVLAATQTTPYALHIADDSSPDPDLAAMLAELAAKGLFSYARNETNLGFVKTVNRALRLFPDKEVVLLNSDAAVHGDWLDRIDRHAKSDSKIATITPMSNNATICSYPVSNANNVVEPECSAAQLDSLAAVCNAGRLSDIPTGVGFCFYMSAASRAALGLLDEVAFGRGYGEENDFCLRAAKAGFRNVLAEDIFVYHAGEVSFAETAADEYGPGQKALHSKHPDYPQRVQQFLRADTSEQGRIRLDLYRLARAIGPGAMVFVSHALTGGIETHVKHLEARLRNEGVAVVHVRVGVIDRWSLEIGSNETTAPYCPNLRPIAFNQFKGTLAEFLGWLKPRGIHIHSLVGFDWAAVEGLMELIVQAKLPYFFTLHDFSVVCHRNDLVKTDGRYCGLPDVDSCRACVVMDRSYPESIDPGVRRATYAAFLGGAAAVFTPSADTKTRLERVGAPYVIRVRPHEVTTRGSDPLPVPLSDSASMRIVTVGAIGVHKGSSVILNLARDAKARSLPMQFDIIGYSDKTDEMIAAGVRESGRYETDEQAFALVRKINPDIILLPSIWPETFCYALSMAFELGILPVVFDLGAQSERVKAAGFGVVLPYALIEDVQGLNDRLLGVSRERPTREKRAAWSVSYEKLLADYYAMP